MKISNKIKVFAVATALALGGVFALSSSSHAITCGTGWVEKHGTCVQEVQENADVWSIVKTALNWIMAIVGVIATVMIILGGIQYSTSAGDSGKVKKAKDTILYGIIGLVIALLSAAIVNFVLDGIFASGEGGEDALINTTYVG